MISRCILALYVFFSAAIVVSAGSVAVAQGQKSTFDNVLVDAANGGRVSMVTNLLRSGYPPDDRGKFDVTPLMRAAYQGHLEVAELLLNVGANPNAVDLGGATALHLASRSGHPQMVKLLLKYGAEIDITDGEGWTPLMRAAVAKRVSVAEVLVRAGADVKAVNLNGETPLMHAVHKGSEKIAGLFLSKGADPNYRNDDGISAVDIATRRRDQKMQTLLAKYATTPASPPPELPAAGTQMAQLEDIPPDEGPAATPPVSEIPGRALEEIEAPGSQFKIEVKEAPKQEVTQKPKKETPTIPPSMVAKLQEMVTPVSSEPKPPSPVIEKEAQEAQKPAPEVVAVKEETVTPSQKQPIKIEEDGQFISETVGDKEITTPLIPPPAKTQTEAQAEGQEEEADTAEKHENTQAVWLSFKFHDSGKPPSVITNASIEKAETAHDNIEITIDENVVGLPWVTAEWAHHNPQKKYKKEEVAEKSEKETPIEKPVELVKAEPQKSEEKLTASEPASISEQKTVKIKKAIPTPSVTEVVEMKPVEDKEEKKVEKSKPVPPAKEEIKIAEVKKVSSPPAKKHAVTSAEKKKTEVKEPVPETVKSPVEKIEAKVKAPILETPPALAEKVKVVTKAKVPEEIKEEVKPKVEAAKAEKVEVKKTKTVTPPAPPKTAEEKEAIVRKEIAQVVEEQKTLVEAVEGFESPHGEGGVSEPPWLKESEKRRLKELATLEQALAFLDSDKKDTVSLQDKTAGGDVEITKPQTAKPKKILRRAFAEPEEVAAQMFAPETKMQVKKEVAAIETKPKKEVAPPPVATPAKTVEEKVIISVAAPVAAPKTVETPALPSAAETPPAVVTVKEPASEIAAEKIVPKEPITPPVRSVPAMIVQEAKDMQQVQQEAQTAAIPTPTHTTTPPIQVAAPVQRPVKEPHLADVARKEVPSQHRLLDEAAKEIAELEAELVRREQPQPQPQTQIATQMSPPQPQLPIPLEILQPAVSAPAQIAQQPMQETLPVTVQTSPRAAQVMPQAQRQTQPQPQPQIQSQSRAQPASQQVNVRAARAVPVQPAPSYVSSAPIPILPGHAPQDTLVLTPEVEVAQAVRVPLSTLNAVQPSAGGGAIPSGHMPRPQLRYAPSAEKSGKGYWIQVGPFAGDNQAVAHFDRVMSAENLHLRMRTVRPVARNRASQVFLRAGVFETPEEAGAICPLFAGKELACNIINEVTSRAPARTERARNSGYNRATVSKHAYQKKKSGAIYWVQLGSFSDEVTALNRWREWQKAHPKILRGLKLNLNTPRHSSSAARSLRVRAGPFDSRAAANAKCQMLRARSELCITVMER